MNPFESRDHRVVRIDASKTLDEDSFHDVFAEAMGFPGFYGQNMNAWIDCMSYVDDPGSGMTTVHVSDGALLVLQIDNARDFKSRCPRIFEDLVECASFVNHRRMEKGNEPVLALSFYA